VPRLVPAERVAAAAPNSLALRILSSLVLAPIAVAAAWFGWPWLPIVVALAGAVMGWEWVRLCRIEGAKRPPVRDAISPHPNPPALAGEGANRGGAGGWGLDRWIGPGQLGAAGGVLIGAVVAAVTAAATVGAGLGIGLAVLGAAIVFSAARHETGGEPQWLALGTLWVALPCVLLLWLARPEGGGRATVLWIFAIVWATDIGAYALGRLIGGWRLAPRWSPRKTWAGLIGGVACAALAGWAAAGLLGSPALPLVLPSAGLAIIGQFGDLAESVAKRRFGVKDSSGLIPGHGGLLDRLDGLLAVIPAAALLTLIGGNVLTWR
jgi:phosphatidate cytidylyltransferase